jgi:hypothetical protein
MDFDKTIPSKLIETVAVTIGTTVDYRPVNTDVAKKAASMITALLQKGKS